MPHNKYRNNSDHIRFVLSILAAGIIVVAVIIAFINFTARLQGGELTNFDAEISNWFHSFRNNTLNPVVRFITELGDVTAYVIIIPIIALLQYRSNKNWQHSIESMIILVSCFLLNVGLKFYFARARPDASLHLVELSEHSFSYPSGHTMTATAFYGFLIYLCVHYIRTSWIKISSIVFLLMIILSVGMSRIYLGAHYPTDVSAGFLVGLIWVLICVSILRFYQFRKLRHI